MAALQQSQPTDDIASTPFGKALTGILAGGTAEQALAQLRADGDLPEADAQAAPAATAVPAMGGVERGAHIRWAKSLREGDTVVWGGASYQITGTVKRGRNQAPGFTLAGEGDTLIDGLALTAPASEVINQPEPTPEPATGPIITSDPEGRVLRYQIAHYPGRYTNPWAVLDTDTGQVKSHHSSQAFAWAAAAKANGAIDAKAARTQAAVKAAEEQREMRAAAKTARGKLLAERAAAAGLRIVTTEPEPPAATEPTVEPEGFTPTPRPTDGQGLAGIQDTAALLGLTTAPRLTVEQLAALGLDDAPVGPLDQIELTATARYDLHIPAGVTVQRTHRWKVGCTPRPDRKLVTLTADQGVQGATLDPQAGRFTYETTSKTGRMLRFQVATGAVQVAGTSRELFAAE